MKIPSAENIGMAVARLIIADKEFADRLLFSAKCAEEMLLENDIKDIETWIQLMRSIGFCLEKREKIFSSKKLNKLEL